MTAYELELVAMAKNRGDSLSRQLADVVKKQAEIESLKLRELTDEEIDQIIKQHDWYSKTWVDMVRSIESAIIKKAGEQ